MIDNNEMLPGALPELKTVRLGSLVAHHVTFDEAVDRIVALVRRGLGGYVVTPNVDHVCFAKIDSSFARAHRGAALSTVDGTPLLWLAKFCKTELPEKISGSDLMVPVLKRAASESLRVAFFGGTPESSHAAAESIRRDVSGINLVSQVWPMYRPNTQSEDLMLALKETRESSPDVIFVAMGTPNQELFLAEYQEYFSPAVLIGIGAGLDFLAGTHSRAPLVMQRSGFEWLYRLVKEPRRLGHRYLVRDRAIFGIAIRQLAESRRR